MAIQEISERDHHLMSPGPKRILALDGGGVRGVATLAFLERIEALLRRRDGAQVRLCDYFDLIGGTSTGAIIATGLAMGMEVGELIDIYIRLATTGFRGGRWHGGLFVPKFRAGPLTAAVRQFVGDAHLGSERIRTGLAIVAKRLDTGSVWVFHNHPRGRYFDPANPEPGSIANKMLPLVDLIRASTAAPTFFAPARIAIADGVRGLFVDGGVSPHNNPSLLLLMLSTMNGFGFRWPTGERNLALISVGTGRLPLTPASIPAVWAPSSRLAVLALCSVIDDNNWLAQTMLQWFGSSPAPWTIDSEIGDLSSDHLTPVPLLHYQRYDLEFDQAWLQDRADVAVPHSEIKALAAIDRPATAGRLLELARRVAARQILDHHLPHKR